MLEIIKTMKDLNMGQLYAVFKETLEMNGRMHYPYEPEGMQLLLAEQDLYASWKIFFCDQDAICALWSVDGAYCAILRLDRYRDGYLLNSLETAPAVRGRGYATALITAVISYLKDAGVRKLYSHIERSNHASVAVHFACGFSKISDFAVYLDGSVLNTSDTYILNIF